MFKCGVGEVLPETVEKGDPVFHQVLRSVTKARLQAYPIPAERVLPRLLQVENSRNSLLLKLLNDVIFLNEPIREPLRAYYALINPVGVQANDCWVLTLLPVFVLARFSSAESTVDLGLLLKDNGLDWGFLINFFKLCASQQYQFSIVLLDSYLGNFGSLEMWRLETRDLRFQLLRRGYLAIIIEDVLDNLPHAVVGSALMH